MVTYSSARSFSLYASGASIVSVSFAAPMMLAIMSSDTPRFVSSALSSPTFWNWKIAAIFRLPDSDNAMIFTLPIPGYVMVTGESSNI